MHFFARMLLLNYISAMTFTNRNSNYRQLCLSGVVVREKIKLLCYSVTSFYTVRTKIKIKETAVIPIFLKDKWLEFSVCSSWSISRAKSGMLRKDLTAVTGKIFMHFESRTWKHRDKAPVITLETVVPVMLLHWKLTICPDMLMVYA